MHPAEIIIVAIIVATAAFLVIRSFIKKLTNEKGCGCGSKDECPVAKACDTKGKEDKISDTSPGSKDQSGHS